MPQQTPLVNGEIYEFATIEARMNAGKFDGFSSINWSHGMDREKVYGNKKHPLGATGGTYSADGSIEFLAGHYYDFLDMVDPQKTGIFDKTFNLVVTFAPFNAAPKTTEIFHVKLKKNDHAHSQGNAGLKAKFELDIIGTIWEDGHPPYPGAPR